jgi:hypothetical protein
MNAIDLMGRLGGSILGHKIRATINGEIVILAKLNGEKWELTEKGQTLANEHSNAAAEEEAAAVKARKKSVAAVESVQLALDAEQDAPKK